MMFTPTTVIVIVVAVAAAIALLAWALKADRGTTTYHANPAPAATTPPATGAAPAATPNPTPPPAAPYTAFTTRHRKGKPAAASKIIMIAIGATLVAIMFLEWAYKHLQEDAQQYRESLCCENDASDDCQPCDNKHGKQRHKKTSSSSTSSSSSSSAASSVSDPYMPVAKQRIARLEAKTDMFADHIRRTPTSATIVPAARDENDYPSFEACLADMTTLYTGLVGIDGVRTIDDVPRFAQWRCNMKFGRPASPPTASAGGGPGPDFVPPPPPGAGSATGTP